jgi:hypothetical protein
MRLASFPLLLLALLAACGGSAGEQEGKDFASVHGNWKARLPNADGRVELHLDGATIRGIVGIDSYVWAVTGIAESERSFLLVLLPSRHEEQLFDALGFTAATAPRTYVPEHAADRVEFRGQANEDFTDAEGIVRSRFGAEAPFFLNR